MAKFIFNVKEGIQTIITAENLKEAQKEFEEILKEAAEVKQNIIKAPIQKTKKPGIYEHILSLREEGFFSDPRTIGDIKTKLSELTYNYPTTSFPTYLKKLIREKLLKRTQKEVNGKIRWVYQNGN